jgi:hypothetical protein
MAQVQAVFANAIIASRLWECVCTMLTKVSAAVPIFFNTNQQHPKITPDAKLLLISSQRI